MTRKHTVRIVALSVALLAAAWFAVGADYGKINFDHPLHVEDAGMACEDCHMNVMDAEFGDAYQNPDHGVCEMCHDVEDFDNCETCHVGDPMALPVSVVGERYTSFAHSTHEGLECTSCHGGAEMEPVMPGGEDCRACHEENNVEPGTHRLDTWVHDHGMDAMMAESDCAVCHTQVSCDECHQGENVLANKPHPPNWRWEHGTETMYGQECLACHETRDECISCHKATVPTPHPLGAQYANTANGGEHVEDAEAFILSCMSCHDVENMDPTCARCHQ